MSDTAESIAADGPRVQRVLSLAGDPSGLRILDLACRTGWFATALAGRGASVLGIEGRASNAALIRPHPNLEVEVGDVRDLRRERHGMFDISLCLGILYHLEAAAVPVLLRNLAEVTRRFAIIDTNTSLAPDATVTLDGQARHGSYHPEGEDPWSAIGITAAFWFTPDDLMQLVLAAGFAAVERLPGKGHPAEPEERMWFRAVAA